MSFMNFQMIQLLIALDNQQSRELRRIRMMRFDGDCKFIRINADMTK